MNYTLFENGEKVETFKNRPEILNHFRTKSQDQPIYVDDTETSVEDLTEVAVDYPVVVEIGDQFVEIFVLEAEVG